MVHVPSLARAGRAATVLTTLLLLVGLPSAPLSAYAAFETVQAPEPQWLRPSPVAQPAGDLIYRLVRAGDQVWLEIRNRGTTAATVAWSLPDYALPGTVISCSLPAGGRHRQLVPVTRIDQGLFQAQVGPPGAPPLPVDTQALAFGVVATTEDPRFAANLLAYTVEATEAGKLHVHLRWEGDRPVHTDWRIVGQPALVLPRLHLLPGQFEEVLLDITAWPGMEKAMVEVWRVRIGEDVGPTVVDDVPAPPAMLPTREGWAPCGSGAPTHPGWNATVVHWQSVTDGAGVISGLRLWNRSSLDLSLRWWLLDAEGGGTVALAAGAEVTVPVAAGVVSADGLLWVMAAAERIDHQPLSAPWPGPSPLAPKGAQAVVPQTADARFNAAQVLALPQVAQDGGVTVMVVNRLACRLEATIALAGIRSAVSLAPGANQQVPMPGLHAAALTPETRVRIAAIKLDGGEAWCGSFD